MKKAKIFFLILLLSLVILGWQQSITYPYNYFKALYDTKFGTPRLLVTGIPININPVGLHGLEEKFGLYSINITGEKSVVQHNGIKSYKKVIGDYLVIRNGQYWKTEYHRQLDSLSRKYPNN